MNVRTSLYSTLFLALFAVSAQAKEVPKPLNVAEQAAMRYDYAMDIFHPVHARNGMVATEHRLATEVGLNVLQQGGNAIDAAVAVGFALAVVLPNAGNLGGGGFMLVHDAASGQSAAVDFREVAPANASRDMYLDAEGNLIQGQSIYSYQAVGVPGTVAGLEYAFKKWGSLNWDALITPAIALAEDGFLVSETLGRMLSVEAKTLGQWPSTRAIFFKQGQPLRRGERLQQKDLAHSLKLIASQGAAVFYTGDIAKAIVADMQQHDGLISMKDLSNYRVIEREPVRGSYRGFEIISMPAPSSGGIHLIQMLNILSHFPMQDYGVNSAESIRLIAEAAKLAYADRAEFLGDPDFTNVPSAGLTSTAYAKELAATIKPNTIRPSIDIKAGQPHDYESDQTTHFSIVDQYGNMVGVTYTLNLNFGSGIVATGTGILLNNEMDDFSAKPGVPNTYGLVGGEANAIEAGKRPLSSMMPTFILHENKPWLVTGTPGGARIITTVLQTVLNSIDHGLNPAENASIPRVHHQWQPDQLRVEKGLSADTLSILRQWGYDIHTKGSMGKTQTIQVRDNGFYGYSDPRNPDGLTLGY